MTAPAPRRLSLDEARRAADRVRRAREAAGLRQKDLAALLGVGQCWVSLRETGGTRFRAGEPERILDAIAGGAP